MKILTTAQIKELDSYTIKHEPVSSIDLMERACHAFVTWLTPRVDVSKKIGIVCGTGNNGGDGLGIARLLAGWEYSVKVWIVKGPVPETEDFKLNLKRLPEKVERYEIVSESDQGLFHDRDVLIDAIFGSGLSRPAEGIYAQAIRCINQSKAIRVAVDIPSGLMADKPSYGDIVRAHYTVSFQLPKLAFFLPESFQYTGEWALVDIGLKRNFIRQAETNYQYVQEKFACRILKPRSRFDHKGTFGHALLIAGSYGKIGAAVLSAKAVMRAGAGLLTVHLPACGYSIMQTAVPEAMVVVDENASYLTKVEDSNIDKYNVIGLGPGLGQEEETEKALRNLLAKFRKPVVIDADGLNLISKSPELRSHIPEGSILTPHPKEFERLVGKWNNDFEKLEKLKSLAAELKSVIVLKGAFTTISSHDGKIYFNSSGNPGMATGGTGDVLTGILTGLMAQNYSSLEAAILGVYLHGLAGDLAAYEKGESSLIASDLIDFLPFSFKKLKRH